MMQIRMYSSTILQVLLIFLLFSGCGMRSNPQKNSDNSDDLEHFKTLGDKIVTETFSVFSGHLKTALEEGGVRSAVQYCSIKAIPLTDSLAREYGVSIRRVSDKYRNPDNKPNEIESDVLESFKIQMKDQQVIAPVIKEIDNYHIAYFAPIIMLPQCLQCHGKLGETLKRDDYSYLIGLYPEDQAIGYKTGDLRGLWSIVDNNSSEF